MSVRGDLPGHQAYLEAPYRRRYAAESFEEWLLETEHPAQLDRREETCAECDHVLTEDDEAEVYDLSQGKGWYEVTVEVTCPEGHKTRLTYADEQEPPEQEPSRGARL